ncbi:hypothetical protein FRB99_005345 [Tulasnella sp. 403]|nr:hypothetical protein FRB99_005345 [Tulasnella sp. 403]
MTLPSAGGSSQSRKTPYPGSLYLLDPGLPGEKAVGTQQQRVSKLGQTNLNSRPANGTANRPPGAGGTLLGQYLSTSSNTKTPAFDRCPSATAKRPYPSSGANLDSSETRQSKRLRSAEVVEDSQSESGLNSDDNGTNDTSYGAPGPGPTSEAYQASRVGHKPQKSAPAQYLRPPLSEPDGIEEDLKPESGDCMDLDAVLDPPAAKQPVTHRRSPVSKLPATNRLYERKKSPPALKLSPLNRALGAVSGTTSGYSTADDSCNDKNGVTNAVAASAGLTNSARASTSPEILEERPTPSLPSKSLLQPKAESQVRPRDFSHHDIPSGTVNRIRKVWSPVGPVGPSSSVKTPIAKPSNDTWQTPRPRLSQRMKAKTDNSTVAPLPKQPELPRSNYQGGNCFLLAECLYKKQGSWMRVKAEEALWVRWTTVSLAVCQRGDTLAKPMEVHGGPLSFQLDAIKRLEKTSASYQNPIVILYFNTNSEKEEEPHFDSWNDCLLLSIDKSQHFLNTKFNDIHHGLKSRQYEDISSIAKKRLQQASDAADKCHRPSPPPSSSVVTRNSDIDELSMEDSSKPLRDESNDVPKLSSSRRRSARQAKALLAAAAVNDMELLFSYPPVNITRGELKRLEPNEFLNDTLIEFGLKLWTNDLQVTDSTTFEQTWVFNSFFYKKLSEKKSQEGYQSVRKWTSKIDIFSKKFIIVPINENLHWYLAVIYEPQHMLHPNEKSAPMATRTSLRKSSGIVGSPSPVEDTNPSRIDVPSIASSDVADQIEVDAGLLVGSDDNAEKRPVVPSGSEANPASIDDDGDIIMMDRPPSTDTISAASRVESSRAPTEPAAPKEMTLDEAKARWHLHVPTHSEDEADVSDSPVPDHQLVAKTSELVIDGEDPAPSVPQQKAPSSPRSGPDTEKNPGENQEHDKPLEAPDTSISSRPANSKTWIYIMDSLGGRHPTVTHNLKMWLRQEAEDKMKITETGDVQGRNVPVPYQPNHTDCGVYLLHFAEVFVKKPNEVIELKRGVDANARGKVFEKAVLEKKRETLKNRVLQLAKEWQASHPTDTFAGIDGPSNGRPQLREGDGESAEDNDDIAVPDDVEEPSAGEASTAGVRDTSATTKAIEKTKSTTAAVAPSRSGGRSTEAGSTEHRPPQPEAPVDNDSSDIEYMYSTPHEPTPKPSRNRGKKGARRGTVISTLRPRG